MDITIQSANQNAIISQVMYKFSISLLLMTAGMIVGAMFVPAAIASFAPIICLVMLIIAFFARRGQRAEAGARGFTLSMSFVYAFAVIMGVGLYPTIMYYTQAIGANLVLAAVASSFALFFGLAIYARRTERNFLSLGSILLPALFALIIFSIVGIFVQATMLQLAIGVGGLVIFSGYVLYDIQVMRTGYLTEADVPMMVLSLFLDFINLLLSLLRIFGIFGSSRD